MLGFYSKLLCLVHYCKHTHTAKMLQKICCATSVPSSEQIHTLNSLKTTTTIICAIMISWVCAIVSEGLGDKIHFTRKKLQVVIIPLDWKVQQSDYIMVSKQVPKKKKFYCFPTSRQHHVSGKMVTASFMFSYCMRESKKPHFKSTVFKLFLHVQTPSHCGSVKRK